MAEYVIDEFIGANIESTLEDEVDKKVSLLYDLCILCRKMGADSRERAVREMLGSCQPETQIHNSVRDAVVGKLTLDEILRRKGYLQ